MSAAEATRVTEGLRYLASRLVTTALIVVGAMLLLFTLAAVVPGDPATTLLGPQATPELARRFIADMGLDQPLHLRLWRFFANVLSGNLGTDVISGRSVAGLIGEVLPYTLLLTFSAIGLAVAIGVPLGVFAATHRGSLADSILAFVSVAFIAVPSFVLAIFLLLIFAIGLDWLPVLGRHRRVPRRGPADGAMDRLHRPAHTRRCGGVGRALHSHALAFGLAAPRDLQYALKNACVRPCDPRHGVGVSWAARSWWNRLRVASGASSTSDREPTIPSWARCSSSSSCSSSSISSSTCRTPRSIRGSADASRERRMRAFASAIASCAGFVHVHRGHGVRHRALVLFAALRPVAPADPTGST
jgi:peptide/nickel transport system permease protein